MLNKKNISSTALAIYAGIIISAIASVLVLIFTSSLLDAFIVLGVVFISSSMLIYWVLQNFVYRKVKLIYKLIAQTKATKREEFYNNELLPQKTIDDVQEEVEKWAEEYKVEIERLESNDEFRKQFLMNLAHELRTPLFASQGYIDTLMDGALEDKNVNHIFLSNASKSIDRLVALVDDLDVISKLESNSIPLHKTEFIIQDLLKDLFDELAQKAAQKKITLKIKPGCMSPINVYADYQKIKQVLVNLLENSIKYGKENGETSAGIYIVDGQNVFVEITDNGIGIAEEYILRVFERFFRTDSARSRSEGGTGLGLAIVKHIIEAHNHTVTCRSKQDVGSSFGFTLDKSIR